MTFSWEDAVVFALALPGTFLSTSYGKPAVKVRKIERVFLFTGREPETSCGFALDLGTVEVLKVTDPATFWQTPHYEGWPAVLARYDTPAEDPVFEMISRSRDWVAIK